MKFTIISKIFPYVDNYNKLKYDEEGLWSITLPKEADIISKIIYNEIGENIVLFDGTAGLGGNVISFSNYFKQIVATEINTNRFKLLKNNIRIYKLRNVTIINDSCINYIKNRYDAYFFDPPWGGVDYKTKDKIQFNFNEYTIIELITFIKMLHNKKIFIKLPFNYNLNEFNNYNYKIHKIRNYQLLVF
jgi:16S rRNA G966 N2-methylase RsmD